MINISQKENKFTIKALDQKGNEVKKVIEIKPDKDDNDYWELGQLLAELSIFRESLL